MPIDQASQRRFVGRSGFGRVDDEDLVDVTRWVERLIFNDEIAYERMMVGLGCGGPPLHVVFGPPGPELH